MPRAQAGARKDSAESSAADIVADHKPPAVPAGGKRAAAVRTAVVAVVAGNTPAAAVDSQVVVGVDRPVAGALHTAGHKQVAAADRRPVDRKGQQGNQEQERADIDPEAVDNRAQGMADRVGDWVACSAETDQIWPYHPSLENHNRSANKQQNRPNEGKLFRPGNCSATLAAINGFPCPHRRRHLATTYRQRNCGGKPHI